MHALLTVVLLAWMNGDTTAKPERMADFDSMDECQAELGDTLHLYLMEHPKAILWCDYKHG